MPSLTSRDLVAVAVSAAFWGVLNMLISPIFWQLTRMPFLCDLLAFLSLTLVVWWTRKFGTASLTGLVVTGLTLLLRPSAFHIVAFAPASIIFDILAKAAGYRNCFEKALRGAVCLICFSALSAGLAGVIIGGFFMGFNTLPSVLTFAGLHSIGGVIGGAIGVVLIRALSARGIPSATYTWASTSPKPNPL